MKVRAVIFDFDMTLVDSSYAIQKCMNVVAEHFGLPLLSRALVLEGIGLTMEQAIRSYWGDYKSEWLDFYRVCFNANELAGIKLFPNTLSTLEALQNAGIAMAIASNRMNVRDVLSVLNIEKYMSAVIGLNDIKNAKPAPDAVVAGMKALSVGRNEILYVGDSDIDMKAAVNADVCGVGVATGNVDRVGLFAAGAKYVCSDIAEIVDLVRSSDGFMK